MRKLFLLIFCIPTLLYGSDKLKVAVIPFEALGDADSDSAKSVTTVVTAELVNSGVLELVDRASFKKLMTERKIQLSGITDTNSAITAGKMLYADKLVIGSLNKMEDTHLITVKVVDVVNAKIEHAYTYQVDSEQTLVDGAQECAWKILRKIAKSETLRPYAPFGLGFVGASIATVAVGWFFFDSKFSDTLDNRDLVNYSINKKEWENLDDKAKDYEKWRNYTYISAGVFAATGLILVLIDSEKFVLKDEKKPPVTTVSFDNKSLYLSVNFKF